MSIIQGKRVSVSRKRLERYLVWGNRYDAAGGKSSGVQIRE